MKTTFYLQFEGERSHHHTDRIGRIVARRISQNKPSRPASGSVVVKMTVDMPEEAFLPLEPLVDIVIPLDRTMPVSVTVEEPDGGYLEEPQS